MRLPLVPAGLGAPGLDTEGNQVLVTRAAWGHPSPAQTPAAGFPVVGGSPRERAHKAASRDRKVVVWGCRGAQQVSPDPRREKGAPHGTTSVQWPQH